MSAALEWLDFIKFGSLKILENLALFPLLFIKISKKIKVRGRKFKATQQIPRACRQEACVPNLYHLNSKVQPPTYPIGYLLCKSVSPRSLETDGIKWKFISRGNGTTESFLPFKCSGTLVLNGFSLDRGQLKYNQENFPSQPGKLSIWKSEGGKRGETKSMDRAEGNAESVDAAN